MGIYSYFCVEFMFVVPRIGVSNDDVACARCIALHANSYVCYISSIVSNNFCSELQHNICTYDVL